MNKVKLLTSTNKFVIINDFIEESLIFYSNQFYNYEKEAIANEKHAFAMTAPDNKTIREIFIDNCKVKGYKIYEAKALNIAAKVGDYLIVEL